MAMEGGIFSDQLPGGRAAATVRVTRERVEATTGGGDYFAIETARCEIDLGGASGRMWFVRTPDRDLTIFSEAAGMAAALDDVPALRDRVRKLRSERTRDRRRSTVSFLGGALALAALVFGSYHGLLAISRVAIRALPTPVDAKLGKLAIETMDLGGPVVKNHRLVQPVERIVEQLEPHADADEFDLHVQVVRADVLNAFALPGGEIVVYTGLLEAADAPEQVAGVLAHEIAHVTERHGISRIARTVSLTAALELLVGDVAGLSALVLELARTGVLTSHDREQEHEADLRGVETLVRARISPQALSDFFALMEREQEGMPAIPEWLASHPELAARREAIAAHAASLEPPPAEPLDVGWDDLVRALAEDRSPPSGDDAAPGAAAQDDAGLNPQVTPGDDTPARAADEH